MTDTPDDEPTPVEQLRDHLDEVSAKPDEMQERLDELEETIEATRRQVQADAGNESRESPASDSDDAAAS